MATDPETPAPAETSIRSGTLAHPDTPRNRGDHDAPHKSPVTPAEDARTILLNKITWGAVLVQM